jgi:hypothetical protein
MRYGARAQRKSLEREGDKEESLERVLRLCRVFFWGLVREGMWRPGF